MRLFGVLLVRSSPNVWKTRRSCGSVLIYTGATLIFCCGNRFFFATVAQVAAGFMTEGVAGCEALVFALLSVEPDVPNANDLILRAAVATSNIAEEASLRYTVPSTE